MSSVPLIEAFGRIVYGFTRGLTEHYNPEEPEYTAEILGYHPLESTGREWYYKPVKELIYQEYGENRASPPSFNLNIRIRVLQRSTMNHCRMTIQKQREEWLGRHSDLLFVTPFVTQCLLDR